MNPLPELNQPLLDLMEQIVNPTHAKSKEVLERICEQNKETPS